MKKLAEAIKEIKETSKAKFDESVEAHFNLNLDPKDPTSLKTSTTLPHGTGKKIKIAVMASEKITGADLELSETDITKLEKGKLKPKTDFDILIVEPKFMPMLAKLGPILGPAGVMPNPKVGTVTEKVADAVKQFKKGKVEIKTEQTSPIVHLLIGKMSFDDKKLIENFQEIYSTLAHSKPPKAKQGWIKSCFISSTMGKSVQIDLNTL